MKPSEYLSMVRSEIDTHGWTQGTFLSDGALCLVGAMNKLAKKTCSLQELGMEQWEENSAAVVQARQMVDRLIRETSKTTAVDFNDSVAQSKQDIFDLLDKATGRLQEAGA